MRAVAVKAAVEDTAELEDRQDKGDGSLENGMRTGEWRGLEGVPRKRKACG